MAEGGRSLPYAVRSTQSEQSALRTTYLATANKVLRRKLTKNAVRGAQKLRRRALPQFRRWRRSRTTSQLHSVVFSGTKHSARAPAFREVISLFRILGKRT